ncbi:MAG TPA: penicillin-binding transpeptidase domain-containing protein [Patescibacteria group bacterium]|nr:penicillin-binding transpeptidase domain-containing protein [Patescibacteria group bacterium]
MNSFSSNNDSWLSWFLRGTLILLFLILFAKLFEVQIIKGNFYRSLSEENRIRHIPLPAARGKIMARGGEALADNVAIKKAVKFTPGAPAVLSEDLTNANPDEIVTDYKRVYPLAENFAHASGYLSVVSDKEVGTVDPDCPEKGIRPSGMLVGVTGLEQEYECQLLGIPGEELVEVNTAGKKIRVLGVKNPVPGTNLKTSIDFGLQKELAINMDKKGAAIVTDPNGQILAFYSSPSFDPNLLINKDNPEKVSALLKNSDLPFFDRVISGTFHPGSVFKPLVAIAALEEGAIDKDFTFNDPGIITVNKFTYTNWYFTEYGRLEGVVNLVKALARSTDTFFYKVGEMVGPVNIAKWADVFDLDKQTGVDLPGEAKGLIPTPEWKQKTIHEGWFLGNTYNMSIGQGDVSVTPIELNTYISAIASNGKLCQPQFIFSSSPVCRQIRIAQNNLDLVKEGMRAACTTGGTAYTFFDFSAKHGGTTVACKTGTAEVGVTGEPNAWFTFFSPIENPQIVSTIVFEKGGQGSEVAGPVARKIADYYFSSR